LTEKEYEPVGGLVWTGFALKSWEIMTKEDIFIPSRLLIANILQIIALVTFLSASIYFIRLNARALDDVVA